MLAEISVDQFREWKAFCYIEPFGRLTELVAMSVAYFQQANRSKSSPALTVKDLIGAVYRETQRQSDEEIARRLNLVFDANF